MANTIELKRDLLNDMVKWKTKRKRKPLVLQGARQVGKSWLLRKFGSTCFDNCVVVNMDKDVAIREVFERTKDPKRLVEQISLIKGQPILPERTLLVIDEIQDSDETLSNILRAYPLDFSKYATSTEMVRIQQVWNSMQKQLAKDNKKFKYSEIQKSARAREYEVAVDWLCRAGLLHKVVNTETARFPLNAYKDDAVFKLYLNDVGLLRRMFHLDSATILEENRLFTKFKGVMTENYVLLSILRQGHAPLYWSSGNKAEIEFLIEYENKIIPIEVKSKESIKARSLSEYRKKTEPDIAVRMSLRNLQFRDGLLNLPLTLTDRMTDYFK